MWDICLIRYKRIARVDAVISSMVSDTVLEVAGAGFTFATSVLINNIFTCEFQVLSDRRMLVTIPAAARGGPIESITVYADTQDTGLVDDMEFALTKEARSGLARVIQQVVKLLLTTTGTDKYRDLEGGSLTDLLRKVSLSDSSAVAGIVATSVQSVERQILSSQVGKSLPDEDRLVGVRLESVSTDLTNLTVTLSLSVITAADAGKVSFALGGSQ